MKKVLALVLSVVLLCSVLPLQVFAREIKYFDFLPKITKYLEHTGGHYNEDNPDEYIYDIRFVPGDILRITAFDNNDTDYTCVRNGQTGELEFRAENGDVITIDELHITSAQDDGDRWYYMDGEDNHHEYTIELEGEEATASLEIVKNTVTNITFMPGEQRHYRFETDGEWKTDGQGQPYFHYALQYVCAGDMLIVGKEGVDYFYEAVWSEQEQQFYFRDEDGTDRIDIGPVGIEFTDDQAENPFTVGDDNAYTVHYAGYSCEVSVTVDTPDITLSYTPKKPIVAYLNTNGQWETDAGGSAYFRYFGTTRTQDGDTLTVTDGEGESTDYIARWNAQRDCREFVSAAGDVIDGSEVRFFDEQQQTHYSLGSNNYFYVEYGGARAAVPVTIQENPVSAIAFTPLHQKEIIENSGGNWETDEQGQAWYNYAIPGFEEGDVLDVTYTDSGETVRYTYTRDAQTNDTYFADSQGNALENEEEMYSTRSGRWSLGDDNTYKVVYFERESDPISISIVPSPIQAIDYIPAHAKVCYYESDGEWDTDSAGQPFFNYQYTQIERGDILRVTDAQGTATDYTAEWDNDSYTYSFVSAAGDVISGDDIRFFDDQYRVHFELGDENVYFVEYMGKQVTVPVSVIASPLTAITYVPQQPITLVENTDGYWTTDDEGNPCFYYFYPRVRSGDELILTYPDSTTKTFSAQWDYGQEKYYFTCGEEIIDEDDLNFSDRQYTEPFTVGENEVYVRYLGQTCTVPVTVITNPVKAVEFIPASAVTYIENTHGYWDTDESGQPYYVYNLPHWENGDVIRVTAADDSLTEYTYAYNETAGYTGFFDSEGNELNDSELYCERDRESVWAVGAQNTYWLNYYGVASNRVSVTIIENPVKAIAYTPLKAPEYFENSGGYWNEDGQFYWYNLPPMREGDVLTVTDQNDVATAYTLMEGENHERYFQNAAGDRIAADEVRFESDQYRIPWTLGNQNAYTAEYCGVSVTLYATVIQNPVKGIDYVPVNPIVIDEGTGGRWIEGEYLYYYDPPLHNGDKLVVTYTDEVVEYVVDMDNGTLKAEDGREIDIEAVNVYSTQNFRPWVPGGDNAFYLEYAGFSKEVPVEINARFTVTVVEPTCTEWGYTEHTDPDSGKSYRSDYVGATGHDFSLRITNESTMRSDESSPEGKTYYYTCAHCGALSNEEDLWFKPGTGSVCGQIDMGQFYRPVMVDLYQGDTMVLGTAVKYDGSFRLDNLEPGTYSAKVRSANSPLIEITGITVAANAVSDFANSENEALHDLYVACGDINGDGVVDFADSSQILANGVYGCDWFDERYEERIDLNGDGVINVQDIAVLLQEGNYGAQSKTLAY
ncbi:MAG: hypothetical protein E7517_00710 [Ruminococcaceae bacterium]|nr:hypothetical protein [Oscillospiraceae bacterium]